MFVIKSFFQLLITWKTIDYNEDKIHFSKNVTFKPISDDDIVTDMYSFK